jgi:hypothetical protein
VDHRQVVQEVVRDLKRYLMAFRGSLATERAAQWDEVVAQLEEAAALLDPERKGDPSRAAYSLIEEAERVLRTDLGQMTGAPFEPQDLRYAALDAHKRLYRQVLNA